MTKEELEQACQQVSKLRADLWGVGGYRPVPIYSVGATLRDGTPIKSAGKRPVTNDWPELARRDPPEAVVRPPHGMALNTGLLCGVLIGIDIDVLIAALVEQIAGLVESTLGSTPLHRIGRAPKLLLCYRAEEPFTKLKTAVHMMPDDTEAHVEILADGQQFVGFGIHPDTMRPYEWPDRSPLDMPLAELPVIDAMTARDLIGAAGELLRAAGGVPKTPPETERPTAQRQPRAPEDETFFTRINDAALAALERWVPIMLPTARFYPNKGTWRVTSEALDRDYQEDLSFAPDGIRDFGDDHGDPNGRGLTAIDAVQEFGGAADPVDAAMWLCDQLGILPRELGWQGWISDARSVTPSAGGTQFQLPPPPEGDQGDDTDWGPMPTAESWPEIDSEAFHGLAGNIVDTIAPLTEADPVAVLAQFLAAFGSAFGRGAFCRVGEARHHPNLYQIIAGETAKGRKGTSYDPVEALFRLADKNWTDHCVRSGLSSGEGIIHAVHDGIWESVKYSPGRGQKPIFVRVLKEKPVTDKRFLVIEQEFASALTVMKRQGNTLASVLRLGWDGRKLQTIVKHSAESATGAHVSVIGHITIEELRFLLDRVAIANGLANRFLILLAKRANVLPFPKPLDPIIAQGFADRIKALLETMDWRRAEVTFSAEARDLWIAEYPTLSAGQPGLFGFAVNRAEAQTLRLAMIYALLDMTYLIAPAHFRAALAFWRYCEASAKYILGDYLGEPLADDILRALRQAGPDGMTRSEIYDMLGRNKSSEVIGAALLLLLRNGKARRSSKKSQGRGRPTEVWSAA
jgi:hypothetical protein